MPQLSLPTLTIKKNIPYWLNALIRDLTYKLYLTAEKIFNGRLHRYDFQTIEVLQKCLQKKSNWIDIGAHQGFILRELLKVAPSGNSYAFEPIPHLYDSLQKRFGERINLYPIALSDRKECCNFFVFPNRPALSGLKRRIDTQEIQSNTIRISTDLLDNIIPIATKIDLIKIDVEGAEMRVLAGAVQTIRRSRPLILFEFGLGGADLYNDNPESAFDYFESLDYNLNTLEYFLKSKSPFTKHEFIGQFTKGYNFFFIAYPR